MKAKEFLKDTREKKLEQLYKDVAATYKELRETRFKIANSEVKNFNQKKGLKRKIAKLWTIIREKEYQKIISDTN